MVLNLFSFLAQFLLKIICGLESKKGYRPIFLSIPPNFMSVKQISCEEQNKTNTNATKFFNISSLNLIVN